MSEPVPVAPTVATEESVLVVAVVGVTFTNEDGEQRQRILDELYMTVWTEGAARSRLTVEIRHEPDNPVDPNARAVYAAKDRTGTFKRIGYLPSRMVPALLASETKGHVDLKRPTVQDMGVTRDTAAVWMKLGFVYRGPVSQQKRGAS